MKRKFNESDCQKLGTLLGISSEKIGQFFGLKKNPNVDFIYNRLKTAFELKSFETIKSISNTLPRNSNYAEKIMQEIIKGLTTLLSEAVKNKDIETIAKIEAFAPEYSKIKSQAYAELTKLCVAKFNALDFLSPAKLLAAKELTDYLHECNLKTLMYKTIGLACEEIFRERTNLLFENKSEDFAPIWEIYYILEDRKVLKEICHLANIKKSIPELEKVYKKLPIWDINEKEFCLKAILSIAKKQKDVHKIFEVGQRTSNDSLLEEARKELRKILN